MQRKNLLFSLICSLNRNVVYKFKIHILLFVYAEKMNEFDVKMRNLCWIFQGDPFSFHSNVIYTVKPLFCEIPILTTSCFKTDFCFRIEKRLVSSLKLFRLMVFISSGADSGGGGAPGARPP